MQSQQFVVVVPVKPPAVGKSRLRVPDHVRPELATAFALDVITAARAVPVVVEVVVMTPDEGFARACAQLGVRSLPEGNDLNDGLVRAAAALRIRWPRTTPAALCADLPCLDPEDLAAALSLVSPGESRFCADAQGSGTTLYTAPYGQFDPRFGHASRAAHEAAGAAPIPGGLATLRRDVDDEVDLEEAMELGTGSHTRAVLAGLAP